MICANRLQVAAGAILGVCVAVAAQQPAGLTKIGPAEYKKLETREATELAVMKALRPGRPGWGEFYIITPFPYDNRRGPKLKDTNPPESELSKMRAGGPGPDLNAEYEGKNGGKLKWSSIGNGVNRTVKFDIHDNPKLDEYAAGYLYGTVKVEKATTLDVTMGSDDALRFWLNGKLLVDDDTVRSLDPEEDKVRLELQPGVNHILAKIGQIKGGYEFQMNTEQPLQPFLQAQLDYQLNLDFPPSEEDKYYRAITIASPSDVVLEVGGLDVLPPNAAGECRPIVCTRRGDVYIVDGAYHEPAFDATFKKFAQGLHEPLGLAVRLERDDKGNPITAVYCTQRGELTRLIDTNGDEVADVYQTFCADWGVSGNYHEFAFGPKFDSDGNAWVTLNVGFCDAMGKSIAKWRGCALKIDKTGAATWVCDGLRSPNGIGQLPDGAMFYLDNQGDFVGTNRMSQLTPGSWQGHPSSLHWRADFKADSPKPPRQPATVWFPYKKMGQSTADFLLYAPGTSQLESVTKSVAAAKFGPFAGQVFVGDQTLCTIERVFLEKVDGVYQGACFPFRANLDSGLNRLCWAGDGSMFIGQTDRGWGSTGRLRYGLQRIIWTGATPFEVQTMSITPDGFELRFTKDLDKAAATNPASYGMTSYTYEYHPEYGSAEVDTARQQIAGVDFVDARTVRLHINKLRRGEMGYVHELSMPGVTDAEGKPLLHNAAYYTVQRIPGQQASATP
jgi:hypothetical protein